MSVKGAVGEPGAQPDRCNVFKICNREDVSDCEHSVVFDCGRSFTPACFSTAGQFFKFDALTRHSGT
jgi:hypothetical protein